MTVPSADPSLVTVPLPSEEELTRVIGKSYDSDKTLNVIKMFAGTDDMYPAVVGFIKAVFKAQGVNPKLRARVLRSGRLSRFPCYHSPLVANA